MILLETLSVDPSGQKDVYKRQKQYYAFNGHGDTVSVTDTQVNLLQGYDYVAFGNEKGTAQTISNPFRYCGEYYDEEIGLIYLRARYYAPKNGRFTQEDPHWNTQNMIYGDHSMQDRQIPSIMAIRQSINLYAYCVNDPIQLIDPNGE